MKILHIITRLIVGGAQENTLLTCEGLQRRGHDVTLLTGPSPGPEGTLMDRANAGGYRVIVTPNLVRSPHPSHDWAAYREIKRLCDDLKPDVVHTHSSKAGIIGRGAAWKVKQNDKPLVVHTIHGLPFHPYQSGILNKAWITAERWAAKRCDAIICVADAMTRQALAAGVGRPEMFTTIYSGMEVEPFLNPGITRAEVCAKLNIPPTAFVFATIARLQPLKGHEDILAYAEQLFAKVPDAHLLWIGDGVFRPRFEQFFRDRKWTNRITMTGLVPPAEVPKLLPAADALVHPSYREGLARALPQGLLAGLPIISYDCDGAAEVCINGKTGILVKTGDARTLCSAMIGIANDRPTAHAMGTLGRQFALERFRAETMVNQIETLYNELQQRASHKNVSAAANGTN
jgi:glycosyltransferase involved in cell wall biosynthesis